MPRRLKLSRIERKPKAVHILASYRDTIGLAKRPKLLAAVAAIRAAILAGEELPSGSYRKGLRTTPDKMLASEGYMHLHLGDQNSRELLYLVQYPDHVVFLEISDHAPLTNKPVGHVLTRFHGKKLGALQAQLEVDAAERKRQTLTEMTKQLGNKLNRES